MLWIFFLIAGLYMVFQKEVKISSKRSIRGPITQKIGLIFITPALLQFVPKMFPRYFLSAVISYIVLIGYVMAIISIFYFIFFYKNTKNNDSKTSIK